MTKADPKLAALQAMVERVAAEDAALVLSEARAEARSRVRGMLTDALASALTEAIERQMAEVPPAPPAPPASTATTAPTSTATTAPGTYVYGVVWAGDAAVADELVGLDGEGPVTAVIEGPVAAVISRVPLAEFEEDELRSHLSDLDWVERVARAHEAVLDDLCARTVVVPMRMCTVYRSDENLRSMLHREEANLRSALQLLDGKLEWGLKVIAPGDGRTGSAPESGAAADDARAASSGVDYLSRRRARRDEEAELEALQADAAAQMHEALTAIAHDGMLNPIQSSEPPGPQGRLVMNGVYLVEREATDAFHREVEELEERFVALGLELVRTGPWPPYNFVPGDVGAAW